MNLKQKYNGTSFLCGSSFGSYNTLLFYSDILKATSACISKFESKCKEHSMYSAMASEIKQLIKGCETSMLFKLFKILFIKDLNKILFKSDTMFIENIV